MFNLYLTAASNTRKIQAIKNVRAATGFGLKDTKDVVDRIVGNPLFGTPASSDRVFLMSFNTLDKASSALNTLSQDGHAEGIIEVVANELTANHYSREQVVLMLADAINDARENTSLRASAIIQSILS